MEPRTEFILKPMTFTRTKESRRPLPYLAISLALIAAGYVLGSAGVKALFLSRIGAAQLPLAYLLCALVTALAAAGWAVAIERIPQRLLGALTWLGLPLGLAALAGWTYTGAPSAVWVLLIAVESFGVIQFIALWGLAARFFDSRAARQAFPRLSAARVVGTATGATLALFLPVFVGAVGMVLSWSVLSLAVWPTVNDLFTVKSQQDEEPHGRVAWREVWASRLVRWMALLGVLLSLLLTVLTYAYAVQVKAYFGDEVAMASFLGVIQGVVTLTSLGTSLLASRLLLQRFGAPSVLAGQSLFLLIGFGLLAPHPSFVGIVVMEILSQSWFEGACEPAYNATLYGLQFRLREQARAFLDGVCLPLGAVLASGLLALRIDSHSPAALYGVSAVLGCLSLVVGIQVARAYTASLRNLLREGGILHEVPARWLVVPEEHTELRYTAMTALNDPDHAMRLVALDLMVELAEPGNLEPIRGCLTDPNPSVRAVSVRVLAGAGDLSAIEHMLFDSHPEPLCAALEALSKTHLLASDRVLAQVESLLHHPSPEVAARSAQILLSYAHHPGATATLIRLAAGSTEQARPALEVLSCHPCPEARPALQVSLRHLSTQHLAAQALLALNPQVGCTDILEVLDWTPALDRLRLGKLLAAHGQVIVPILLAAMDERENIGPILEILGLFGAEAPVGLVRSRVTRLVTRFGQLLALRTPLHSEPLEALLDASLDASLDELARHLFSTACCGMLGAEVAGLLEALDGTPSQRASALELAERKGYRPLLNRILPWLEGRRSTAWSGSGAERLMHLSNDPEPWLRTCAQALLLEDTAMSVSDSLAMVRRVATLRSTPLFAGLSMGELRLVAENMEEHTYPIGTLLVREGDPSGSVFFIVEGLVRVFRGEGDDIQEIAHRGPGEHFGEMGVLNDQPRSASLEVIEPVCLLSLDRANFQALILERPRIGLAVIASLSERIRALLSKMPGR